MSVDGNSTVTDSTPVDDYGPNDPLGTVRAGDGLVAVRALNQYPADEDDLVWYVFDTSTDGPPVDVTAAHFTARLHGWPIVYQPGAAAATITREYAIQVDSVVGGWVSGVDGPPFRATVGGAPPSIFGSVDLAHDRADIIGKEYRRLGQPDMVDQIHVVSRTVTTTRSAWTAVDPAELEHARTLARLNVSTGYSSPTT